MTSSLYLRFALVGLCGFLRPCFDRRSVLCLLAITSLTASGTDPAWCQIRIGESTSGSTVTETDARIVQAQLWESAIEQVSDPVLKELHELFFDIAVVRGSSLLRDYSELALLVETVEMELEKRNIHFVRIQLQTEDKTSDETIYAIGDRVSAPVVLSSSEPDYTDQARAAGIEGTVVLEVVISKEGSVEVVEVVQSLEPGLDDQAIAAMSQWKFRPAYREGQPVNSRAKVDIHFSLQ